MADAPRDHGGGLDAAMAEFGGTRDDWIDLSTGINPIPYPIGALPDHAWQALPDSGAMEQLIEAARRFWSVPEGATVLAAPGVSSLIARLPALMPPGGVAIPQPTYNEFAGAFKTQGWQVGGPAPKAHVYVHPNNPDGRLTNASEVSANHQELTVIDESFCDVTPDQSLIAFADRPGHIVLKGLGKFWGLAGLRLGFAIGCRDNLRQLAEWLGPWPVSGPALQIGAKALGDVDWANQTRTRLAKDAARLDQIMTASGAKIAGGTSLFRLYDVPDAKAAHRRFAESHILTRIFPYSDTFLRLGLPGIPADWQRVEQVAKSL